MKKICVFVACLFCITLVSCNGSNTNKSEEGKEPIETTSEEPAGTDFLENYEKFVNQEIDRLEKSPNTEAIAKSVKSAQDFVNKYGDPNAISMTPEAQEKFNKIRGKYESALQNVIEK